VTNRRITSPAPMLADLTVSLLREYGVAPSKDLVGKEILTVKN